MPDPSPDDEDADERGVETAASDAVTGDDPPDGAGDGTTNLADDTATELAGDSATDSAGDGTPESAGDSATDSEDVDAETGGSDTDAAQGGRSVVVPLSLYKRITVFSTLFAVVFVLGGFVLLDTATNRATAPVSEIDPLLAILGLVSLVFGAAIYAFSTRFRTEEMGKAKDDSGEESNNG